MEDALAHKKKIGSKIQKPVLILVVMEDALALFSPTTEKASTLAVLILVVMEDALAQTRKTRNNHI